KTVGAGLVIGFCLPDRKLGAQSAAGSRTKVNTWIRIGTDDSVTLEIHKSEMGQGTVTSLSQLLAEELECDWKKIRTEFPGVDPAFGLQGVFGSQSIRSGWTPLRTAGAQAREMLAQAAAERWNIGRSQCRVSNGVITNTSNNETLTFGQVAEAASKLTPPTGIKLKTPDQFRFIGKSMKRLDTPDKVTGRAKFGIDARVPGMVYAAIARSPVFGGKVVSFDATKAKAIPGVKDALKISNGVAVIAGDTWTAFAGAKALEIQWDEGPNAAFSTPSTSKMFAEQTLHPGASARHTGEGAAALAAVSKKIEAVYEAPFLAHAPMEPLNCVAHVQPNRCEVWASTQLQTGIAGVARQITGLQPSQIEVHTLYMGGGFGRRAGTDFAAEAIEVAKAIGVPVKVTWSRENDIQNGNYRPASVTRFAGGLDAEGWPSVLTANIACPPMGGGGTFGAGRGGRGGVDSTSVEGISDLHYAIPNMQVDYHSVTGGVPTTYWRSVGYTQNTFFAESFLDELAAAGGKDPVELRRRFLAKTPRLLGVLNLAAEKAGWGKPLPAGHFHGVAVVNNVGSFTAQVAEVSVNQGKVKVHKVVCATDCGQTVNPAIIQQQIRSAIIFGLSAALKGEITIDKGRVQQSNFDSYDVVRMDEAPAVEVHIVPSTEAPGGMGEAGVPCIAPAVCNAIFRATGKRIRRLPIANQLV
ncbi:MAG TPA: xanthine dehydrogenase family protein molybdopterin-binding subunit, partial [Bryobacteraceae bacterium]|nr:xanthine dehydrogenase family protein molybdopterin-binding subunit [Bryobacteraceae bacterium]